MPGAKKCVYCGAAVHSSENRVGDEFKWNVQDFPKPRKKANINIDWGGEKIIDEDSGRTYFQKESRWKEPEEAKSMFNFDVNHENLQEKVDKKLDDLAADEPEAAAGKRRNDDIFVLPSEMQMEDFSDLLNDTPSREKEPEKPLRSSAGNKDERRARSVSGRRERESAPADHGEKDMHKSGRQAGSDAGSRKTPAAPRRQDDDAGNKSAMRRKYGDYDPFEGIGAVDAGEVPDFLKKTIGARHGGAEEETVRGTMSTDGGKDKPEESGAPHETVMPEAGYTEEEERRAVEGFQSLLNAEKTFSDQLGKPEYMSDDELEKARRADRKRENITGAADISFRTLEDEYERYRESREKEERGNKRQKPSERAGAAGSKKPASGEKKPNKKNPREVNIKINEPSGTKYTVKTQEIDLSKIDSDNVKTQPVDLDKIKQGPKSIQVQVEVSSSESNSSVEVTRRHDGATVVKTLENGHEQERSYDGSGDSQEEEPLTGESFWEKGSPDPASRMTITDIFGPEAKDFRDKWEEEEKDKDDSDMDDSMILSITPEDIALTKDQTQAIETVTPSDEFSEVLDQEDQISPIDDEQAADSSSGLASDAEKPAHDTDSAAAESDEKQEAASETEEKSRSDIAAETAETMTVARAMENIPEEEPEIRLSDIAATLEKALAGSSDSENAEDETAGEENGTAEAGGTGTSGTDETGAEEDTEKTGSDEKTVSEESAESEEPAETPEIQNAAASDNGTAEEASSNNDIKSEAEQEAQPEQENKKEKEYDDITTYIPVDRIKSLASKDKAASEEKKSDEKPAAEEPESEKPQNKMEIAYEVNGGTVLEKAAKTDAAAENEAEKSGAGESEESGNEKKHVSFGERLKGLRKNAGTEEKNKSEEEQTRETEEEAERAAIEKSVSKAEPEKKNVASRIMQIIIIVLIIAIALEFLIIGIKLFAPDSQGALLISRIEQSFSGEAYGSYHALEQDLGINLPADDTTA
jgi:hypothetical protein